MAPEALDRVKIEIRSILLSSKHGVAAESIESDYEMLICQRLPLKELGFKDVQSLMRAIPDVAKEVRSHRGDITYYAVSEKSTAHIHKLVSHQATKKKISTQKYKKKNSAGKYGALGRGGIVGKEEQPRDGSSLHTRRPTISNVCSCKCHEDGGAKQSVVRTKDQIIKWRKSETVSCDSGDNRCEQWGEHGDLSATHEVRHFKNFRIIAGCSVMEPSSSQSDTDTKSSKQTPPVNNLRICVSQSGKRQISVLTQCLWNNEHDSRSDLRDFISRRQSLIDSVIDHESFNSTSKYMKVEPILLCGSES